MPRKPTAMEAAAMTAGPVRNRTAIANEATEFPHAIILGCSAINKPTHMSNKTKQLHPPFLPKMEKDQKNPIHNSHPHYPHEKFFTISSFRV